MSFGPEYHKIQTVFKRTERGIIIPDQFTTDEIAYLAPLKWRWTEKIDGTNIRLHYDGKEITVGGRTDNAQIPGTLVFALAKWNNPELWAQVFPPDEEGPHDVTVYGEGYGAGIQKGGGLYRQDKGFIVFDVRIGSFWLKPAAVAEIATKLGMDTVPIVGEMTMQHAIDLVDTTVKGPDIPLLKSAFPGVKIEGIVGTPLARLYDAKGERMIVKLKLADFEALAKNLDRAEARQRIVETETV